MSGKIKNLVGNRYGRLVVQKFDGFVMRGKQRRTTWICLCDCGTEKKVVGTNLKTTNSCGCWNQECRAKRFTTHGMHRHPDYHVWSGMISRCHDENIGYFHLYGGRGITVCERWKKFENFIEDMGPRPSKMHSIDRFPNKDGNYEKSNCRWATPIEQGRNMRTNRIIEFNGKSLCLAEWAELYSMPYGVLHRRLEGGMSMERATSDPIQGPADQITFNGQTLPMREWERITGILYNTINKRRKRGLSAIKILSPYSDRIEAIVWTGAEC